MPGPNFRSYLNPDSAIHSRTLRSETDKILGKQDDSLCTQRDKPRPHAKNRLSTELGSAIFAAQHPEIKSFNLKLVEMENTREAFLFACEIQLSGVAHVHSCLCEGSSLPRPLLPWRARLPQEPGSRFLENLFTVYYAAIAGRETKHRHAREIGVLAKMAIGGTTVKGRDNENENEDGDGDDWEDMEDEEDWA